MWLAPLYSDHTAESQEGVEKSYLCCACAVSQSDPFCDSRSHRVDSVVHLCTRIILYSHRNCVHQTCHTNAHPRWLKCLKLLRWILCSPPVQKQSASSDKGQHTAHTLVKHCTVW